jgi:hypothetical protein
MAFLQVTSGAPGAITVIAAISALFAAMFLLIEAGRRIGIRHHKRDPKGAGEGLGAIEGAVFGLMGLLVAFTFSGAGARFDARRQLVAQEANAIGTAYLRISLLPESTQANLRQSFREYLDARLEYYRLLPGDRSAADREADRFTALQAGIWNQAVEATRQAGREANANAVTSLVIQSLNEMIDITTTRYVALKTHPPAIIFWMLISLVLACSVLAGYGTSANKSHNWIHCVAFVTILAVTVLVILDYEYPRFGFIRVDAIDQVLRDLRASMR